MYSISFSNKFKKDFKLCKKRGYNISLLEAVIVLLEQSGTLPGVYKPHKLSGNYAGLWECHIKPDWLLIWSQDEKELTLLFMNTGTHSDLF